MHVDGVLARVAARQLGNLTRSQLVEAGVSVDAIDHWVRRGRLHSQFRGVYALGHVALPPFSREMAAVLACGDEALLSHASAAYVWGFRPPPADHVVDVTVTSGHVRRRPGIRVHLATALRTAHRTKKRGIPITSPARTLIDIAPELDARELELALHEMLATRLVSMTQVKAALEAYPRRRGTARLVGLVAHRGPTTLTHRGAEEKLFRLIRKSDLPRPLTNHRIGRFEADFYWPQHGLVVEVDGGDFHSTLPTSSGTTARTSSSASSASMWCASPGGR